jgi:hypothetical protein
VGDIWSLTKTNAALSTVTLNTENDAAELGKGHEFATQVFKSHWDVSGSIEKFLTSEIAAWALSLVWAAGEERHAAGDHLYLYATGSGHGRHRAAGVLLHRADPAGRERRA